MGRSHRPHRPASSSKAPPGPHGQRRGDQRRDDSAIWLFGDHASRAAAANPCRTCRRLVAVGDAAAGLRQAAGAAGVRRPEVETVNRRTLEALVGNEAAHQGMAVLAEPLPSASLDSLLNANATQPFVVLDRVTDPRNVGAVLRAAAAFDVAAVVVQDRHAPSESGALAKAASGALETVPLVRVVNVARALRTLQEAGYRTIGLAAEAPATLAEAEVTPPVAVVLGAEGAGLRHLVRSTCDILVRIPISESVESLNVASAAAIALYVVSCGRGP